MILYQEQVMQIANRLAGFSLGEADMLRRAMGKKKHEEMAAQREKFLSGCAARKVPQKKAEKIFDLMAEFAGYGFNKSHSCAYALLAYQTAYLKTHYPVEFMAALLTSETGNTEKVVKYINEARSMGITVLPPDVNSSDLDFTPMGEPDSLRASRHQERGREHGEGNSRGARRRWGASLDFFEFCESMDTRLLNKRVLESLIRAGAMDGLGAHRSQMIAVIDRAMERAQKMQRARESGQHGLVRRRLISRPAPQPPEPLPEVEEWPEHETLASEYSHARLLHFRASARQIRRQAEGPERDRAFVDGSRRNNEDIVVAGIIVQSRPMRSRRGARGPFLRCRIAPA